MCSNAGKEKGKVGWFKKKARIVAWAAALCLLAAFPASVCAGEAQDGQGSRTVLTARVNGHSGTVEEGKGSAALGDGTTVTAEGSGLPDGLLLVVERITEEENGETYAQIAACMEGLGTNLQVYDIYFVDGSGQRYEADGQVTIAIRLDGTYKNPAVYYVPSEGKAVQAKSSVSDGSISFAAADSGFCVLAEVSAGTDPGDEKESEPASESERTSETEPGTESESASETEPETESETALETESETESETTVKAGSSDGKKPAQGTGAKTGDETDLALWIVLCGASAAVFFAGRAQRKKRSGAGR